MSAGPIAVLPSLVQPKTSSSAMPTTADSTQDWIEKELVPQLFQAGAVVQTPAVLEQQAAAGHYPHHTAAHASSWQDLAAEAVLQELLQSPMDTALPRPGGLLALEAFYDDLSRLTTSFHLPKRPALMGGAPASPASQTGIQPALLAVSSGAQPHAALLTLTEPTPPPLTTALIMPALAGETANTAAMPQMMLDSNAYQPSLQQLAPGLLFMGSAGTTLANMEARAAAVGQPVSGVPDVAIRRQKLQQEYCKVQVTVHQAEAMLDQLLAHFLAQ
jgi:hypothetical protein